MAGIAGAGGGLAVELNPIDVARVRANLTRFDRNLGTAMKAEGQTWARALTVALGRAANSAPAPQTHRFSDAADVEESDETGRDTGATVVNTADGAGFYNDSAVLQATEHGSELACFQVDRGGPYWIGPTVRTAEPIAVVSARRTSSLLVARCNAGG